MRDSETEVDPEIVVDVEVTLKSRMVGESGTRVEGSPLGPVSRSMVSHCDFIVGEGTKKLGFLSTQKDNDD